MNSRIICFSICPPHPVITETGQVVPVQRDKVTGIGRIMINRHTMAEELEIKSNE